MYFPSLPSFPPYLPPPLFIKKEYVTQAGLKQTPDPPVSTTLPNQRKRSCGGRLALFSRAVESKQYLTLALPKQPISFQEIEKVYH